MVDDRRRELIKWGIGALALSMVPFNALAAISKPPPIRRTLDLYNTHTGEQIRTPYFLDGAYCPDGLDRINHVLRDHRTGAVASIDPRLLDLLFTVKEHIGPRGPFHVISGYRSPQTNDQLRRSGNGVARRSFHTTGEAVDVRLPGYSTQRLRQLCLQLRGGGVGFYPRSDFVHLDIGPVRSW